MNFLRCFSLARNYTREYENWVGQSSLLKIESLSKCEIYRTVFASLVKFPCVVGSNITDAKEIKLDFVHPSTRIEFSMIIEKINTSPTRAFRAGSFDIVVVMNEQKLVCTIEVPS